MDAYIDIAIAILRRERRPLSPRAILMSAYRCDLVPQRLHGKTQHKTLQARLSEDIIERKEQSPFFRTAPGRFFLREFLTDTSIPDEFRRAVPTRRRFRELMRGPALAIDMHQLENAVCRNTAIKTESIIELLRGNGLRYEDPRRVTNNSVLLRSFVCVWRDTEVLTYRLGRYRDNRDSFLSKRSLGFSTLINIDEHTLFNLGDFGIVDSGVRAAKIDLDFPVVKAPYVHEAALAFFVWVCTDSSAGDLIAVVRYECPEWFEPVKRRLALNDLRWLNMSLAINDLDDFDPWSRSVLFARNRFLLGAYADSK